MNYSTSVFLINQKVRAVSVNYEPDEKKQTTYKTLDETIAAGDYVVVPTHTRHKFTVARVVEVDVDVDFDSPEPMTWIVARIDRSAYDLTLKQEDAAIAVVKSAEIRRKRDELAAAMLKDNKEKFKLLDLADLGVDKVS
jgi:molybdopterin-binding protein